ncbi:MAG: hypothetical protein JRH20_17945 [Deltaproteobacteria bacterium]|nr:hypothetical protein [Deltaproteobacteria bacterium]
MTYLGGFLWSETYSDDYQGTMDPELGLVPFILWLWAGWAVAAATAAGAFATSRSIQRSSPIIFVGIAAGWTVGVLTTWFTLGTLLFS